MDRKIAVGILILVFLANPVSAEVNEISFKDGSITGEGYLDGRTLVVSENESTTFVSSSYARNNNLISGVKVTTSLYKENSSSNISLETSNNNFETVKDTFKKELKEGSTTYDLGDVQSGFSYRVVIEASNAVDVSNIAVETKKKGLNVFSGSLPVVGQVDFTARVPQIPYAPQMVAASIILALLAGGTYWRRTIMDKKIQKFRRLNQS